VMARKHPRPAATQQDILAPLCTQCAGCGQTMWVAYHTQRTITTLQGICHLTLCVRRCRHQQCPRYHCPYRQSRRGQMGLTARRVRSGRDCSGWDVALYLTPEHSCASIRPSVIGEFLSPNEP
jgi:hypothetical protein